MRGSRSSASRRREPSDGSRYAPRRPPRFMALRAADSRREYQVARPSGAATDTQRARERGMYGDAIIAAMVIGMPSLVVTIWMILRHREKMSRMDVLPHASITGIEARLARLEDAIDGIALEMERLGEGQRFTAKLLAER